ncbi:uncharacterized protein LOC121246849 isoform X2 [Juglans microcarpa x Juglans regia]|uniref:uncharacterized protein LOC121246849 isoform X2 n=1 Tax=Juglans microcarpa x Juglans regia TaxID=2249226 RepID=UPI001B7E5955|nr:uncharacterized protein LOC121246849 isoform X2 [Juglans microcarpa x Juglans regia]
MGAKKRRQPLRIPLSDSTNLNIPSTILTLSTPFPLSRHANVFHAFNSDDPTSFSSPPPQSLNASSVHGIGTCEISETCSVYGRRKTTDKQNGKARSIAAPSSCPPAVKTQQAIRKRINKDRDKGQSEASIAPPKKVCLNALSRISFYFGHVLSLTLTLFLLSYFNSQTLMSD